MRTLRLAHLYPDLMNLYGDSGNITALTKRCQWREIDVAVEQVTVGEHLKSDYDLVFIGGGQDREQMLVYQDLLTKKAQLRTMVDGGLVVLAVCGGYQLLGHRFLTYQGDAIEGLGLLDVTTVGGTKRMIGNVIAKSQIGGDERLLIGFENHSGRTKLGAKAQPLARLEVGFGNNGTDKTEGAHQGSVFGTYLHGSLLPKNPWFADHLLGLALKKKYGNDYRLRPLDDALEEAARSAVAKRIGAINRRRRLPEWFKR